MKINYMRLVSSLGIALAMSGQVRAETSAETIRSKFSSPVENGYVIDGLVPVTMKCDLFKPVSRNPNMPLSFQRTEFNGIWYASYRVTGLTKHSVALDVSCGLSRYTRTISVTNIDSLDRTPARKMSNTIMQGKPATELKWDWTDAIMLFGLESWAQTNPADYAQVSTYIKDYQKHFAAPENTPTVNWADRCPSALTAVSTWQRFGQPESLKNLNLVTQYIKTTDRNRYGAINHLGDSLGSLILPDSIWVDSLMMYGLVSVKAGIAQQDEDLLNFGLRQQVIFAERMIDPATKLYYHAWYADMDHPYPITGTQWLRGNGWVGASLLLMLQELAGNPDLSPETLRLKSQLEGLARQLAAASRPYMGKTRMFDTWMTAPGAGYQETSGTALMAYLYVKGANMGLLDDSYRQLGLDIYRHLTARLLPVGDAHIAMPGISIGTNPSPPIGYIVIPRKADMPYGQGAYLLLAGAVNGGQ